MMDLYITEKVARVKKQRPPPPDSDSPTHLFGEKIVNAPFRRKVAPREQK